MKKLLLYSNLAFAFLLIAAGCQTPFGKRTQLNTQWTRPLSSIEQKTGTDCYPTANPKLKHYIVGFGSLMSSASKLHTAPKAGKSSPVLVQGFRRGFFVPGSSVGISTTFLGVLKDNEAEINAVTYKLPDLKELYATDKREKYYCRVAVDPSAIKQLTNKAAPNGKVWVYVTEQEDALTPSKSIPIVQSYVDIFLTGCLELEKKFGLKNFAKKCIQNTTDWSEHWENDRVYPRRPHVAQPNAAAIDKLLQSELPQIYRKVILNY